MIIRQLKYLTPVSQKRQLHPRLQLQFRVNSLPSVVRFLSVSITLSLVALILAARIGAVVSSNMTSAPDPLAAYLDIMPGQPKDVLREYGCQQAYSRTPTTTCSIVPAKGLFHLVSVGSS